MTEISSFRISTVNHPINPQAILAKFKKLAFPVINLRPHHSIIQK